jgi:hypothetical protein
LRTGTDLDVELSGCNACSKVFFVPVNFLAVSPSSERKRQLNLVGCDKFGFGSIRLGAERVLLSATVATLAVIPMRIGKTGYRSPIAAHRS